MDSNQRMREEDDFEAQVKEFLNIFDSFEENQRSLLEKLIQSVPDY